MFLLFILPGPPEPVRLRAHAAGDRGLQDEAVRPGAGAVAVLRQRVRQRLLDAALIQAHAGLPQVRLLPDHVGHRGAADGGVPGARGGEHGRAQEEVVSRGQVTRRSNGGKSLMRASHLRQFFLPLLPLVCLE